MPALFEPNHVCFSKSFLRDYQLGKLLADETRRVDLEAYTCPTCTNVIAELDTVTDGTVSLISSIVRQPTTQRIAAESHLHNLDAAALPCQPPISRVGDYQLEHQLGQGGMGVVWKARHLKLGREVALKMLPVNQMASDSLRQRFDREKLTHCKLNHPNLVTVFDAGEANGVDFLAMELLDGWDLSEFTKDGQRLSIANACEAIRQAAEGVAHAHERGFIHRDLKPSNLRLTRSGIVKVLDMGLMKAFSIPPVNPEASLSSSLAGTVGFMAPEQFRNQGEISPAADVFGLAATLYSLLTLQLPFPKQVDEGIISQAIQRHLDRPTLARSLNPQISPSLSNLVNKALSRAPAERFATAREFEHALLKFTRGQTLKNILGGPSAELSLPVLSDKAHTKTQRSVRARVRKVALFSVCIIVVLAGGYGLTHLIAQARSVPPLASFAAPSLSPDETVSEYDQRRRVVLETAIQKMNLTPSYRAALKAIVQQKARPEYRGDDPNLQVDFVLLAQQLNENEGPQGIEFRRKTGRVLATQVMISSRVDKQLLTDAGLKNHIVQNAMFTTFRSDMVLTGSIKPEYEGFIVEHDQAVTVVVASHDSIQAFLQSTSGKESLSNHYCKVARELAKNAFENKNFELGFSLVELLLESKFASSADVFGAVEAVISNLPADRVLRMLENMSDCYPNNTDVEHWVKLAQLAEKTNHPNWQSVAKPALRQALLLLQTQQPLKNISAANQH